MKIDKALKRDRQQQKRRHGMRTTGRSVFTIQHAQVKRATTKKGGK